MSAVSSSSSSDVETKDVPAGVKVLAPSDAAALGFGSQDKYQKRKQVKYQGRTVYEWEQELTEVHIYITPPPSTRAKDIACSITADHLTLGIKGNPPYIDEDFGDAVNASASFWTLEDGIVHLTLEKAHPGQPWSCACKGQGQLNAFQVQQEQQKLLLQRFQMEHPGFDFSNAEFSGDAPDPRAFLGGIDHTKIK